MVCWCSSSSLKSPRCRAERGRGMSRPSAFSSWSKGMRVGDGCRCWTGSAVTLVFRRLIRSCLSEVGVGEGWRSKPCRGAEETKGLKMAAGWLSGESYLEWGILQLGGHLDSSKLLVYGGCSQKWTCRVFPCVRAVRADCRSIQDPDGPAS